MQVDPWLIGAIALLTFFLIGDSLQNSLIIEEIFGRHIFVFSKFLRHTFNYIKNTTFNTINNNSTCSAGSYMLPVLT